MLSDVEHAAFRLLLVLTAALSSLCFVGYKTQAHND